MTIEKDGLECGSAIVVGDGRKGEECGCEGGRY